MAYIPLQVKTLKLNLKGRLSVLEKLDDIDKIILKILQANARTPYTKIAKAAGVSEATVHLRVRRLKDLKVIKGLHAVVNPLAVGKGLIAITLLKTDPLKHEKVLNELKKLEDIYEVYDVTGEHDAILKIRASSKEELARIIDKIGAIAGVSSTQTMIVLKTIKEECGVRI